ncbi:MAG: hypothetical protein ABIG64_04130 [Candidatus Omnitrophota bacterium]
MFKKTIGILLMLLMVAANISVGCTAESGSYKSFALSEISTLAPILNIEKIETGKLFDTLPDDLVKKAAGEMAEALRLKYNQIEDLFRKIEKDINSGKQFNEINRDLEDLSVLAEDTINESRNKKYPTVLISTVNGKYFESGQAKYAIADKLSFVFGVIDIVQYEKSLGYFKNSLDRIKNNFNDFNSAIKFLEQLKTTKNKIIYTTYDQDTDRPGKVIDVVKTISDIDSKIMENIYNALKIKPETVLNEKESAFFIVSFLRRAIEQIELDFTSISKKEVIGDEFQMKLNSIKQEIRHINNVITDSYVSERLGVAITGFSRDIFTGKIKKEYDIPNLLYIIDLACVLISDVVTNKGLKQWERYMNIGIAKLKEMLAVLDAFIDTEAELKIREMSKGKGIIELDAMLLKESKDDIDIKTELILSAFFENEKTVDLKNNTGIKERRKLIFSFVNFIKNSGLRFIASWVENPDNLKPGDIIFFEDKIGLFLRQEAEDTIIVSWMQTNGVQDENNENISLRASPIEYYQCKVYNRPDEKGLKLESNQRKEKLELIENSI